MFVEILCRYENILFLLGVLPTNFNTCQWILPATIIVWYSNHVFHFLHFFYIYYLKFFCKEDLSFKSHLVINTIISLFIHIDIYFILLGLNLTFLLFIMLLKLWPLGVLSDWVLFLFVCLFFLCYLTF